MSLKYVLAERAGLKLQPQNGWRNMRVSPHHNLSAITHRFICQFIYAPVVWKLVRGGGEADKGLVSL